MLSDGGHVYAMAVRFEKKRPEKADYGTILVNAGSKDG